MKWLLFLIFIVAIPWMSIAQTPQCIDSLDYSIIRQRWNSEFSSIKDKEATWLLPAINTAKFTDTFKLAYSLYKSEISATIILSKDGCVKSMKVYSKRDEGIAYQATVAMVKLLKVFNHNQPKEKISEVFQKLVVEATDEAIKLGNNTYKFSGSLKGNELVVLTAVK